MGHTPFGYGIENGVAVVDEHAAEQVQALYQSYLSGDSLRTAANKVGIDAFHAGIGKILKNRHYLGDDYYPTIIDPDTFAAVQEERFRRASALGRLREPKEDKAAIYPTTFHIIEGIQVYDDPFAQASYAYSLIESEV
ncbi:MAG: recombinase [Candidatus Pacebacteria bacterium]|nr:recombinase [Candidatus Paceibacterota bacterium]